MHSGRGAGSLCAEAGPDSPAIASAAASPAVVLRSSFLSIVILPRFAGVPARLARTIGPGHGTIRPRPGSDDEHWVRNRPIGQILTPLPVGEREGLACR